MASPSLSCPYCNAILTENEVRSSRGRALCPRCGETFPLPAGQQLNSNTVAGQELPDRSSVTTQPSRFSNRTIAFSILTFMGLLAAGFFWYAWETQEVRREHDSSLPKSQSITIPIGIAIACNIYIVALIFAMVKPQNRPGAVRLTILLAGITTIIVTVALMRVHIRVSSDPNAAEDIYVPPIVHSVRPAELSGLSYLPDDTNVIVVFNIGELMETPAGREFLSGNSPSPIPLSPEGSAPGPRVGDGGGFWNWQRLQEWTGISLNEIDHVIIGLKVDNNLLPRLIVVIETNRPLSAARVKERLRAGKVPDKEAYLFPSDRVVILGLTKNDLQSVSAQRKEGIGHLSLPLQQTLKERIPRGDQVWAVGQSDDWQKTPALAFLAALPKEDRAVIQRIQTFAIAVRVEQRENLGAAFRCSDESAAKAFERWLRQQKPEEMEEMKISQQDDWVSLQAKVTDISPLINRMKIAPRKPQ
jgi:hypothetical protein